MAGGAQSRMTGGDDGMSFSVQGVLPLFPTGPHGFKICSPETRLQNGVEEGYDELSLTVDPIVLVGAELSI